jgi:predicted RNA-binding protein with PUA-like domain
MHYWLVKSEPGSYSWDAFVKDKRTAWTGVRNFQARNNLRAMQRGDLVFFYHSGEGKDIVGLARVDKEAYPDPTATEGDWSCVDLVPVKALVKPVTLGQIKSNKTFADMQLVKLSRISVTAVGEAHFQRVLALAGTKL